MKWRGPASSLLPVALAVVVAAAIGALAADATRRPQRRTSAMPATSTAAVVRTVDVPMTSSPAPTDAAPVRPWLDVARLRSQVGSVGDGEEVGVALRPLGTGRVRTAGQLQVGAAWSTMKVPVVLARYALAAERSEPTAALHALARRAIESSDNAAAQELFDGLVSAYGGVPEASASVQAVLRAAGDRRTEVNSVAPAGGFSTFGQTAWRLADGTQLFRALARGCLPPSAGRNRSIVEDMRRVIPAQRWGVGRDAGGRDVAFKGGWGPGADGRYLVRQFAIVRDGRGHGLVVGIAARSHDGSFASGIALVDRLAAAVRGAVDFGALPRSGSCS